MDSLAERAGSEPSVPRNRANRYRQPADYHVSVRQLTIERSMIVVTAASTVIRGLVVLVAVTFVAWRTADLCYHLLLFAGMSIDDKIITFVMLAGASLIAALVGLAAFLLVRVIQHKQAAGFLGCGPAFWKRTRFVFGAGLGAFTLAIFLLLVLPLVGADLRLRWVVALCAIAVAPALIVSSERSMALLLRLRLFERLKKPRQVQRGPRLRKT